MSTSKKWDIFICHASEDKQAVAHPLADYLQKLGFSVWYDEFELTVGDSLREKIDEGLANSRFGLVILSPKFFENTKKWTKKELGGLFAREATGGGKVILPVLHNLTHADLVKHSPMLADAVSVRMEEGIDVVAKKIRKVLEAGKAPTPPEQTADIRQDGLIIARTDRVYQITGTEVFFNYILVEDGQNDKLSSAFEYNGHMLRIVQADTFTFSMMPPPMGHRGPVFVGAKCAVLS